MCVHRAGADVSAVTSSSRPSQRYLRSLWDERGCSDTVCCTVVSYRLCVTVSNRICCSSVWYVILSVCLSVCHTHTHSYLCHMRPTDFRIEEDSFRRQLKIHYFRLAFNISSLLLFAWLSECIHSAVGTLQMHDDGNYDDDDEEEEDISLFVLFSICMILSQSNCRVS